MPNGIYPVSEFRLRDDSRTTPRPPRRTPVWLSLRALWHRARLDDLLARGISPAGSKELEWRAAQLLRGRSTLAAAVESTLERAHRPSPPFSTEVRLRRGEVLDCADDLLALTRRLRDGRPIDVQGAAMTSRLVTDGASPLYFEGDLSLRYAVRSARLALDPLGAAIQNLPAAA
ncbi:MAG: hypothetical protein QOH58_1119 [Thermoleophilaceae bacterium]|nr:hypothetical protein [Thermoleophilaceae bacterium]